MQMDMNGKHVHWATGGMVSEDADAPVLVLVHGAGMDGTIWQLQSRYLAHRGVKVMALDLPGHGASDGPVLENIPDMADWVLSALAAANVKRAVIAGHSMGALIALQTAAGAPELFSAVGLLGCAAEMPVHPGLIKAAEDGGALAPELVVDWGFGTISHKGGHPQPGLWAMGAGVRLLMNADPGVLARDLVACDVYKDALAALAKVTVPVHLIAGDQDKMAPVKATAPLLQSGVDISSTVLAKTGHMMMIERPREVAKMLLDLARTA